MSKKINYNQRYVTLYYSNKSAEREDLKTAKMIVTKGSGEGKDYKQAEQEAQLYLIKNALTNKPRGTLRKIVGIKQDVSCYEDEQGSKLKLTLEGMAVFV